MKLQRNGEKIQSNHRHGRQWSRQFVNRRAAATIIISLLLLVALLVFAGWFNGMQVLSNFTLIGWSKTWTFRSLKNTCSTSYPTTYNSSDFDGSPGITCPSYFRWIHEDLRPWKETGITKDTLEQLRKIATFRLVIVNGRAYVERYRASQTRDMFTLWGIIQLLKRYPGKLPDLDLMFECSDQPLIHSKDFQGSGAHPPPLFGYCSDELSLDIVFPDWSFWGWAEKNIRPWRNKLKEIIEANKKREWKDRLPYAYWRGDARAAHHVVRKKLLKCNVNEWNIHAYALDWRKETKKGFKHSSLEDQCTHRYKIYVDGRGWSASRKYILACDSMTLYIKSHYFDFFSRGLQPLKHYWPIRDDDSMCPSLKFAVEWGNSHLNEAMAIGKAATNFIQDDLKMDFIYDYMFHLLNGYAKLLRFKPEVPQGAVEICEERIGPPKGGNWKKFMVESSLTSPSNTVSCTMPPPYDAAELKEIVGRNDKAWKQVETWGNGYWENTNERQ